MQTKRCPTIMAVMAKPGLSPLVMEDEATWYIEILKASATQNPRSEGHVHFLFSDSKGMGSRSLLEASPSLELAKESGSVCSLKHSSKPDAILETSSPNRGLAEPQKIS